MGEVNDDRQRETFKGMGFRMIGSGIGGDTYWCGPYDPLLVEWRSKDGILHLRVVPTMNELRARWRPA